MTALLATLSFFLALFFGADPASPDSILPPPPEGWRHERLSFPLSFAPTLGDKGVEELYFAPGMFDPESETYFSYVFAIRIEESATVDHEWISDFLQTYYAGLCEAVGKSRGLELDLSQIKTEAKQAGDRFEVKVHLFDAFVTGKPMMLRLEMSAISTPGAIELFGCASPLAKKSDVWKDLRDLHRNWRRSRVEIGALNHVFLVPDQRTFDAILASEFACRELATFESRTTVRADSTYSGIYFYGESTYFELLPPEPSGLTQGSSGVAFALETPGESTRFLERMQREHLQTESGPVTRALNQSQIPWFEVVGVQAAHANSKLSLFTMEYSPDFLARWHPNLPPKTPGIHRREILTRYRSHLQTDEKTRPLMVDVTRVRLALDPAETKRFLTTCRGLGSEVEFQEDRTVCRLPGIVFEILASSEPGRILEFTLSLRSHVSDRPPLRLGNSEIRFEGNTATWKFEHADRHE